jgi:hypothetical protein
MHLPSGWREYHIATSFSPLLEGFSVGLSESLQDFYSLKEDLPLPTAYRNIRVQALQWFPACSSLVRRASKDSASTKHTPAFGACSLMCFGF